VNISIRQCMHQRFVQDVTELCEQYLAPELRERLVFEITETVIREEVNRVVAVMEKLRRLGIRFSMDDFGTGYSALGYLKRLPVDELKIDRTFVEDLDRDEQSRAMAAAILGIAGFLGLRVVAEGIENETQFEFLREKACDLYQGFHLSKPLDEASFVRLASGDETGAEEQLA
jgi:FOG: EAL domain